MSASTLLNYGKWKCMDIDYLLILTCSTMTVPGVQ